jgi:hypothetical protein
MPAAAAADAGSSGGSDLAATYATVQCSLHRQFYGDLVDLRVALLGAMNMAPQRTAALQPKMLLVDTALSMLEVCACTVQNCTGPCAGPTFFIGMQQEPASSSCVGCPMQ